MRNVMKLAGAAFIGVLGIWLGPGSLRFWQTAPPTSNLPEHIVRPTVKTIGKKTLCAP